MAQSTVTKKGQTTVPSEIRHALRIGPRAKLEWTPQGDGSAIVRGQPSALTLFGVLKSKRRFRGLAAEKRAIRRAMTRGNE